MPLNDADLAFLSRRARLIRWWPVAGITALVIVLGVFASLFFFEPFLANPMVIFSRLEADEIPVSSLALLAAFVPILSCMLLAVVLIMFVFAGASLFTEKRYLSLIDKTAGTALINGRGTGTGKDGRASEPQWWKRTVALINPGHASEGWMEERHAFDFARFDDPVADLTTWDATRTPRTINRGFRPVLVHSGRLEFRAPLETRLVYFCLIMLGAGLAAAPLVMPGLGMDAILLPVGLCIAGAAVLMLYQGTSPMVFDKRSGMFWKGRQAPTEALPDRPIQPHARLDNIHALQIIAKYSSADRFCYSYLTHELNLVFKDGEREHLLDGTALARTRMDAQTLGLFLEKPVWDATIIS